MESEVHYRRVGIFILAGIILITTVIFWLTNILESDSQRKYRIYFERQSLDGLQKDSPVTMKGIKIGSVDNYEISEENIQRVSVTIRLEDKVPIKVNSKAVIKRNLLTGLAKIDILGGTQDAQILDPTSKHEIPVIQEEVTQFDKIADSVPSVLEKIQNSLENINLVLSQDNVQNFGSSLSSISKVTSNLEALSPKITTMINNFEQVSEDTASVSKRLFKTNSEENIEKRLNNTLRNLEEVSKNLNQISGEAGPLARTSGRSLLSIQDSLNKISESLEAITDSYGNPNLLLKSKEERK